MSAIACFHCGYDDVASGQWVWPKDSPSEQTFCCHACACAHDFIVGLGLDAFYQYQNTSRSEPVAVEQVELSWQDDVFIADYCTGDTGARKIKLQLQGLHCAACVWLIERYLYSLPQVSYSRVRLDTETLNLHWDDRQLSLASIVQGINRLGYSLRPYLADESQSLWLQQQAKLFKQIALSGIVCMQLMMMAYALYQQPQWMYGQLLRWASWLMASAVFFYVCKDFVRRACTDLANVIQSRTIGHLSMDVPIALAMVVVYSSSTVATISGVGEVYFESLAMFSFFLLLSRYMQAKTQHRITEVEQKWQQLLPQHIKCKVGDKACLVACGELKLGDVIVVDVNVCLPVDGTIIEGETSVDECFITGEFSPQFKAHGAEVLAGSINLEANVLVRVDKLGENCEIARIHQLLEQAIEQHSPLLSLSNNLASYVVLFVLLAASLSGGYWYLMAAENWLEIAVSVLVITCPCALSLAIPTALTSAMVRLKELGVLVKRAQALHDVVKIKSIFFDKTGTLTQARYSISDVETFADISVDTCSGIAGVLLADSQHPIAGAFHKTNRQFEATQRRNHPGFGVEALLREGAKKEAHYKLGNREFVGLHQAFTKGHYSMVYLSRAGKLLAVFYLQDALDEETKKSLDSLRLEGLNFTILSGDAAGSVAHSAEQLGIARYHANCRPQQKMSIIQSQPEPVMMVGDGINDLPCLAAASLSVAVVSQRRSALIARGDVVLMRPGIRCLPTLWRLAGATRKIIRQNLIWAGLYNAVAVPCAVMGLIAPWAAVIGMSVSSVLVVANSVRLLRA